MTRKDSMTARERYTAVLNRQKPDRISMDYRGTAEVTRMMMRHLGVDTPRAFFEKLHIDEVVTVAPRYIGPKRPEGTDIYGCELRVVDYGTGSYEECANHPLAGFNSPEEIEANYTWPTADWFDFSDLPSQAAEWEIYPIMAGGSEPFLNYKYLRGEMQAFTDLLENPEIIHYCMGKMYGFAYEMTRRIYEKIPGRVLITYIAEDLGSQSDLLYSPEQIREFFFPHMKRMIDLAHDAEVFAFTHSDGAIRRIIPDYIELGIDALDPIQWRCAGMEREGLKKDFGDHLIFHGGVDNQQTLPFGTPEDVRREVIENLNILGANGGYILGPCHNIQPVSPPENVVALYETGYEFGWS